MSNHSQRTNFCLIYEYFQKETLDTVDWESWLHKPGMLPVKLTFDDTLLKQSKLLAEQWANVSCDSFVY